MSIRGSARALDRLTNELAEPVARLQSGAWSRERLTALLARAELRAWRIEAIDGPGLLSGCCPLGSGRVRLAYVGEPVGSGPDVGGYVVGRAIPVGAGRWVLLGRVSLVAGDEVAAGFEQMLVSLRAPRGEFWRVHGGVIARAARALVPISTGVCDRGDRGPSETRTQGVKAWQRHVEPPRTKNRDGHLPHPGVQTVGIGT